MTQLINPTSIQKYQESLTNMGLESPASSPSQGVSYQKLLNAGISPDQSAVLSGVSPETPIGGSIISPKTMTDNIQKIQAQPSNPIFDLLGSIYGGFGRIVEGAPTALGQIGGNIIDQSKLFTDQGQPNELMRALYINQATTGSEQGTKALSDIIEKKSKENELMTNIEQKQKSEKLKILLENMREASMEDRQKNLLQSNATEADKKLEFLFKTNEAKIKEAEKKKEEDNKERFQNYITKLKLNLTKDPSYKSSIESYNFAVGAEKSLNSGTKEGVNAVKKMLVRMQADNRISDLDFKNSGVPRDIIGSINSKIKEKLEGTFSASMKEDIQKLINIYKDVNAVRANGRVMDYKNTALTHQFADTEKADTIFDKMGISNQNIVPSSSGGIVPSRILSVKTTKVGI